MTVRVSLVIHAPPRSHVRGRIHAVAVSMVDLLVTSGVDVGIVELSAQLLAGAGDIGNEDAIIVVTLVQRRSLPAAIVEALDLAPPKRLLGMPVALVTCGRPEHRLVPDRCLSPWFGSMTLPGYAHLIADDFNRGRPNEDTLATLGSLVSAIVELTTGHAGTHTRRRGTIHLC